MKQPVDETLTGVPGLDRCLAPRRIQSKSRRVSAVKDVERQAFPKWVHSLDAEGRTSSATYMVSEDQRGVSLAGYCQELTRYNDSGFEVGSTYLDIDGRPCLHYQGIARRQYTYDDHGELRSIEFFGVDGNPTIHQGLRGASVFLGTVEGQNIMYEFHNLGGALCLGALGLRGLVKEVLPPTESPTGARKSYRIRYLGESILEPATATDGTCGFVHHEYAYGYRQIKTGPGPDYAPRPDITGVSQYEVTWSQDRQWSRTEYFNEDGNPCPDKDGVYGFIDYPEPGHSSKTNRLVMKSPRKDEREGGQDWYILEEPFRGTARGPVTRYSASHPDSVFDRVSARVSLAHAQALGPIRHRQQSYRSSQVLQHHFHVGVAVIVGDDKVDDLFARMVHDIGVASDRGAGYLTFSLSALDLATRITAIEAGLSLKWIEEVQLSIAELSDFQLAAHSLRSSAIFFLEQNDQTTIEDICRQVLDLLTQGVYRFFLEVWGCHESRAELGDALVKLALQWGATIFIQVPTSDLGTPEQDFKGASIYRLRTMEPETRPGSRVQVSFRAGEVSLENTQVIQYELATSDGRSLRLDYDPLRQTFGPFLPEGESS